jgi:hypothetical protein
VSAEPSAIAHYRVAFRSAKVCPRSHPIVAFRSAKVCPRPHPIVAFRSAKVCPRSHPIVAFHSAKVCPRYGPAPGTAARSDPFSTNHAFRYFSSIHITNPRAARSFVPAVPDVTIRFVYLTRTLTPQGLREHHPAAPFTAISSQSSALVPGHASSDPKSKMPRSVTPEGKLSPRTLRAPALET